jgi:hypothetical protein
MDVLVLRADQLAVQAALGDWDLQAADPLGALRPWRTGERLTGAIRDIWCRPTPISPWALQVMLGDTNGGRLVFRRDTRITVSLTQLTRHTTISVPFLAPEVQLLYKANERPLPKDEADFAVTLPLLEERDRRWLAQALHTYNAQHPWLASL